MLFKAKKKKLQVDKLTVKSSFKKEILYGTIYHFYFKKI